MSSLLTAVYDIELKYSPGERGTALYAYQLMGAIEAFARYREKPEEPLGYREYRKAHEWLTLHHVTITHIDDNNILFDDGVMAIMSRDGVWEKPHA